MRLSDVRLLVDDFNRARDFYRDVMQLEMRVEVPDTYAEFVSGGLTLGVYRRDLMAERVGERWVGPAGGAVACFEVDDADDVFVALVDRGATPVREPQDEPTWSLRVAHIADPDGHIIELDERLPTT